MQPGSNKKNNKNKKTSFSLFCEVQVLGLGVDSVKCTVEVPEDKVQTIKDLAQQIASSPSATARSLLEAIRLVNGAPAWKPTSVVEMATDASTIGWERFAEGNGAWQLEMLAVFRALLSFEWRLRGKRLRILTDSMTVRAELTRGGSRNPVWQHLVRQIWQVVGASGRSLLGRVDSRLPERHCGSREQGTPMGRLVSQSGGVC